MEIEILKVLEGIRVLDFGRFIAGPFCAALLADYGADVIRVDRIGGSDDRFIVPVSSAGEGALFLQVNRNKRSLTLDLAAPEGKQVMQRLIRTADVVVANMPARTMEDLGLDYESLRKIKPDIILTASSAFGTQQAVRNRTGFDGVGQCISGSVHITGYPDHPIKAMVPTVDFATALSCALGTVLALYERRSSGMGQEVSTSLLRTGLNIASGSLIEEAILKLDRKASANRSPNYGPSDIFRAKDGWVIAQVIGPDMFERWTRMIGRQDILDDPRFANDKKRGEHGDLLSELMSEWCGSRTRDECLATLENARIPAGPVQSPRQVLDDEQVKAAESFHWMTYPGIDEPFPIVEPPVWMSRTQPAIVRRPPTIGEHTDEILREIGYSMPDIELLRSRFVV